LGCRTSRFTRRCVGYLLRENAILREQTPSRDAFRAALARERKELRSDLNQTLRDEVQAALSQVTV
jgi:hypothetical protein